MKDGLYLKIEEVMRAEVGGEVCYWCLDEEDEMVTSRVRGRVTVQMKEDTEVARQLREDLGDDRRPVHVER